MGRYGLGFGALSSARGSRGGSPADTGTQIVPAAGWTGTAASGFGGNLPSDPVRVTAKPALRLITPPNQAFTNSLVMGVIGGANDGGTLIDNLGLEMVRVHFEGAILEIAAPTLRSFANANGETVSYFGWWVTLSKPANIAGEAHVYFEAVPRDATMQNRVMGPYSVFPRDTLYDVDVEVDPGLAEIAGTTYQTVGSALNYVKSQTPVSARIRIVGGAQHDFLGSSGNYTMPAWCVIEASDPITFRQPIGTAEEFFRLSMGRVRLRGSNITVDFANAFELYELSEGVWCDGINLTNSAGRDSLFEKRPRSTNRFLLRSNGTLTECTVTNLWHAGVDCELVRGGTFSTIFSDLFSGAKCVIGTTSSDLDNSAYRSYIDALSVAGPANATLEMSGSNSAGNRVVDAKVNGASVGTFAIQTSDADAANYNVVEVVAWLNTLSGWTATLLDDTRFAASLQADGTTGAWGPIDVSATTTISTFFDSHSDIFQTNGENIVLWGNVGSGINAQVFFHGGGTCSDFLIANNAFDNGEAPGDQSQFGSAQNHVVFAHNVLSTQTLLLGAVGYDPDTYSLVANNALAFLNYGGTPDSDLLITFNHLSGGASAPVGAVGTSTGGNALGNFTDAAGGDFTPQGALLAYPKPPTIRHDAEANARRSPVAPVGAVRGPIGGDAIAPAITSADPSGTYAEGIAISGTLAADEPVTWSVTGAQSALVTLNSATGAWSLEQTDFESRASYDFSFVATDGSGNISTQAVSIAITNVFEQPALLELSLDTTTTQTGQSSSIAIQDRVAGSTLALLAGALPAGISLNSAAGTIVGTPTTAQSASFTLQETLADSANSGRTTALSITVEGVDDTNPAITSASTVSVMEDAQLSHVLTADESVTWSIVGGIDQADFELSGDTLRWASNGTQDFESPADSDADNNYTVTVRATDAAGNFSEQTIIASVTDVAEGGSYSAEATTYFAAMAVQPDATQKGRLDALISALVSAGIWSKLDYLMLAGHDAQSSRVNAIDPSEEATTVNSPSFTAFSGYTGDGSSAYIDLGETVTAGPNYAQDDAHVGVWLVGSASSSLGTFGTTGNNSQNRLRLEIPTSGNEEFRVNDNNDSILRSATGSAAGYRVITRESATTLRGYFGGALVADLTDTSDGVPVSTNSVLRRQNTYSQATFAVFHKGGALTAAQVSALNTHLSTYLTAIGAV